MEHELLATRGALHTVEIIKPIPLVDELMWWKHTENVLDESLTYRTLALAPGYHNWEAGRLSYAALVVGQDKHTGFERYFAGSRLHHDELVYRLAADGVNILKRFRQQFPYTGSEYINKVLMHPTKNIEMFRSLSTTFGALAIRYRAIQYDRDIMPDKKEHDAYIKILDSAISGVSLPYVRREGGYYVQVTNIRTDLPARTGDIPVRLPDELAHGYILMTNLGVMAHPHTRALLEMALW